MSSDEEEYANEFFDDSKEVCSPNFRPSSSMLGLFPSTSSGPDTPTGKFYLIITGGESSYGYNAPRSNFQPLKRLQIKSIEENSEKQSYTQSCFSEASEATHKSSSNHSRHNSSEEETINHFSDRDQQKVKGHIYKESCVDLNKNSDLNEENEKNLTDDDGGDDDVRGKINSQKSKVNSYSLVDNKPIAEMFEKDFDKRGDIIKSIWSGSSKCLSGQRSDYSQVDKHKTKLSTTGLKNDEVTVVTKPESQDSGGDLEDGSGKEFPKTAEKNNRKTEISWKSKQYTGPYLKSHVRNNEESFGSIEKDIIPLSHNTRDKGLISQSLKGTDQKSLKIEDITSKTTKTGSTSTIVGKTEPISQQEGANNVTWNEITKNKEMETKHLYVIREPNDFRQISQPHLFENYHINSSQEFKKILKSTGESNNLEGDQSSKGQRSRTSDASERISFQNEGTTSQPPSKPQRSRSSTLSNETLGSFQDVKNSDFRSESVASGGFKNGDGRYDYSESSGKSNKSENKQFSYGDKGNSGVKTVFQPMQKMMTGMKTFADENGFQICDVSNDGNCVFAAVVDQLYLFGDFRFTTTSLRHAAVKYLEENPCHEDGSHLASFLDHESWEEYLTRMDRDSEWGDHLILTAIVEVIQRCITVYNVTPTTKSDITLKPFKTESDQSEILYLGHYGEEHFVSLRPNTWESTWYKNAALKANLQPMNDNNPKVQRLLGQGEDVNVDQQTKDILEDKFGMDSESGTPLPHLSYMIKALLPSKCIMTDRLHDRLLHKSLYVLGCRKEITGTMAENLNFNLSDLSYYTKCSCAPDIYNLSEDEYLIVFVVQEYTVGVPHRAVLDRCDFTINTKHTHPGYVRLEPISQRCDFIKIVKFKESGPFIKHLKISFDHLVFKFEKNIVSGLKLNDMLSVVPDWIQRDRLANWPSSTIIEEIAKSGCILAAKPHPESNDPDIEWQVLFPEAEKILAQKALSKEQRYCFSIFKVLVDCQTRELDDKLSVNHLKSILYFTCEVVSSPCWLENVGGVLLYMIQRLLECLREGQLPNYFIKENNMIDHFSEEGRQLLKEKIEAIRIFPVMSMLFIAKRHGILCSSAMDAIVDDFDRYRSEGRIVETVQNVFLPSLMKLAKSQYYGLGFQQMFNIVSSAYEELQVLAKSDIPEFPEFFKKLLFLEKNEEKRFKLAFCLDYQNQTSLSESLLEGTKTKSLQEVVRTEINEKFSNLKIPINMVSSPLEAIDFLDAIAWYLYISQDYEGSAYFLRCGIAKVKKELNDDGINLTEIIDMEVKKEVAKQNYFQIQNLNMRFYELLEHLYMCYSEMRQIDLFLEYMEDLEELSDRMGDSSVYNWVSTLWEHFGSQERANLAKNKM